jgi:hypothetical protein
LEFFFEKKLAADLIIASKELVFQNVEKEKRTAGITDANLTTKPEKKGNGLMN